jgi:hypothetical protein
VLFEGVLRVPFEEVVPEGLLQLAAAPRSGGNSPPELFKQLTDTLLQVIDEQWWPEGMHVVLHSSGYDSRLISWALTKLRGQRDLGQLLFLCTREEGSVFRQVMKYERWEPNQYLILDEALEPSRYFASELTDFSGFWTQWGTPVSLPFNTLWHAIMRAQKQGLLPLKIQTWSGFWGNELLSIASSTDELLAATSWLYACQMASAPIKGTDVVLPLTDLRLLLKVRASSLKLWQRFRFEWLKYLDPVLAAFENLNYIRNSPPQFASDLRAGAQKAYNNSWYGQHVTPIQIPLNSRPKTDWGHFTAASLIQDLIDQGYEVS